jgi:hypothetical protein
MAGKPLTGTSVKTEVGSGDLNLGATSVYHPTLRLDVGAIVPMTGVELRNRRTQDSKGKASYTCTSVPFLKTPLPRPRHLFCMLLK